MFYFYTVLKVTSRNQIKNILEIKVYRERLEIKVYRERLRQ